MRVDLKPRAEKRVTQTLVLQKIAEVEKTEVSDAETALEIDNTVASYPTEQQVEMRRTYSSTAARETVKSILQVRKATQRLIDIAKSSYTKTEENALAATPAAPEKEAKDE
jgi:FKBP-type peptidyl-prolyl cis-trans isomerase (trigger factor)